jgi:hypothetical protein
MAKIPEQVVILTSPERVEIDLNSLPAHASDTLCRVLIRSVNEYFKRPGVDAEFKRWKKERQKQRAKLAAAKQPQ